MSAPARKPARPWTDADTDELVRRHAAGETCHSIAKVMDRNKRTISLKARGMGLTWDRSRTAAATRARVLDAKDRRTTLADHLLADAERLRAQLWEPATYTDHGGKDFRRVTWTQDEPVFADKLKLMQAMNVALEKHLRLVSFDNGSAEQVRSLLAGFAEQLGLTGDSTPDT